MVWHALESFIQSRVDEHKALRGVYSFLKEPAIHLRNKTIQF
jgi:hypothetical protein